MEKRLKGGGGLSRKLLTILVLAAMPVSGIAVAQSAATGPNKVYIEQVGDSNTVTIQQVGGSNNVGGVGVTSKTVDAAGVTTLLALAPSSTNYGTITGSSNILAITQTGNGNSAQYSIQGNDNQYTSTVTGHSNQTKLEIGDLNNASNLRNIVTESITGDSNLIMQNIVGSDITSTTIIGGNSNQITKELKSSNGTSDISITGDSNVLNIQQVGAAGANGHYLKQVITGDFNSITTQQQGTNDTTVDIRTNGSNNTVTVRTSSATILLPATAIAR
jgi:hypothetical protein